MPHGQPPEGFKKVWGTVPARVYDALLEFMGREGYHNLHQACSAALVQWHGSTLHAVLNPPSAVPLLDPASAGSGVQNRSESRDEAN